MFESVFLNGFHIIPTHRSKWLKPGVWSPLGPNEPKMARKKPTLRMTPAICHFVLAALGRGQWGTIAGKSRGVLLAFETFGPLGTGRVKGNGVKGRNESATADGPWHADCGEKMRIFENW